MIQLLLIHAHNIHARAERLKTELLHINTVKMGILKKDDSLRVILPLKAPDREAR